MKIEFETKYNLEENVKFMLPTGGADGIITGFSYHMYEDGKTKILYEITDYDDGGNEEVYYKEENEIASEFDK